MTAERTGTTATLPAAVDTAAWPGRWRALAVSQVAAFMALLDVSIVNVALPSIQRDLSTSAAATATGPVAGGLILTVFSGPHDWRWVFYINAPIGLLALVLARRFVSARAKGGPGRPHLDLVGALLLGGAVLGLLLPLVNADTGGLRRLAWLFGVAALLAAGFAWWENRTVRLGRQPLLHPQLLHIRGYPAGSAIGMVYFLGFTGIWLVLALFFQHGLGYTPLRSGLAVTPFALGMATSAAIAGRLVLRIGRGLTVAGLVITVVGLVSVAVVLRQANGTTGPWVTAVPLLVAGFGGGMVTSPNLTLTLQRVPVAMAGAAGGALQTAQRIGAAAGSAVLVTVFYHQLGHRGGTYAAAVFDTLLCAAAFMTLALVMAIVDVAREQAPPVAHRPE